MADKKQTIEEIDDVQELKRIAKEKEKFIRDLKNRTKAFVEKLQADNKALMESKESLMNENKKLESSNLVADASISKLEKELSSAQKELASTQSMLEEKKRQEKDMISAHETTLQELRQELKTSQKEAENFRSLVQNKEKKVIGLEKDIKLLKERQDVLDKTKNDALTHFAAISEERDNLFNRNRELESQLKDGQNRIALLEKQLQENNQTATSDTKRLVQELVQLKTIVRDREDQCKQFSLQIEQLEKAKKEAEESRSNAEEMLAEASDRINRVTEAQVELLQENQDLKAKLDESLNQNKSNEDQNRALKRERDAIDSQLKAIRGQMTQLRTNHEKTCQDQNEKILSLEQELQSEKKTGKTRDSKARTHLKNLQEEVKSLQAQVEEKERKLSQLSQHVEDSTTQLHLCQENLHKKMGELSDALSQAETAEESTSRLKKQLEELLHLRERDAEAQIIAENKSQEILQQLDHQQEIAHELQQKRMTARSEVVNMAKALDTERNRTQEVKQGLQFILLPRLSDSVIVVEDLIHGVAQIIQDLDQETERQKISGSNPSRLLEQDVSCTMLQNSKDVELGVSTFYHPDSPSSSSSETSKANSQESQYSAHAQNTSRQLTRVMNDLTSQFNILDNKLNELKRKVRQLEFLSRKDSHDLTHPKDQNFNDANWSSLCRMLRVLLNKQCLRLLCLDIDQINTQGSYSPLESRDADDH